VALALLPDELGGLPPVEGAQGLLLRLALGQVGGVVLGEGLGVDEPLGVPGGEPLDALLPLVGRGGEDRLAVDDDAVVVVVRLAAVGRDEVPGVGAEGAGDEGQRDDPAGATVASSR